MPPTARTLASGPCTGAGPTPHPRLVHLNGPPGVGRSTLARLLAADDPGTLVLDADAVVAMIAGWRDDTWATLPAARRPAAAMAREHVAAGHDVVLPQLVTSEVTVVPDGGGGRLPAKIRGDLMRYLEARVPHLVLDTTGRTAEQSYRNAARVLRPGTVGATG